MSSAGDFDGLLCYVAGSLKKLIEMSELSFQYFLIKVYCSEFKKKKSKVNEEVFKYLSRLFCFGEELQSILWFWERHYNLVLTKPKTSQTSLF